MRWLPVLGVLALAAAITGALWKAHDMGKQAGIAESAVVLARWKATVEASAHRRREAQQQRYQQLQGEFDELRSRPERIRTITRTVRVEADDRCESLPASYRQLWDAGYESGVRVGTATATSRLDDAGRVAVADAAAVAAEARERFERNAAALTALQTYIRSVVLQEKED